MGFLVFILKVFIISVFYCTFNHNSFIKNIVYFIFIIIKKGGLSVAIPGEIYGYWEAYKLGGKLPWKELFQPAIEMCTDGFRISHALGKSIIGSELFIRKSLELSKIFVNPITNETYKENDLIKMPKLADTLKIISEENITAFYNGSLVKIMVDEINENGLVLVKFMQINLD